jgi:thioredoxin 1
MTIHAPKSLSDILTASLANPSKLVVVDFKATWCGPCKAIHPFIKNLAATLTHTIFMEVDVEDEYHADTVNQFGVTAMPTFVYIKAGKVVDKTTGADQKKIVDTINKHSGGN